MFLFHCCFVLCCHLQCCLMIGNYTFKIISASLPLGKIFGIEDVSNRWHFGDSYVIAARVNNMYFDIYSHYEQKTFFSIACVIGFEELNCVLPYHYTFCHIITLYVFYIEPGIGSERWYQPEPVGRDPRPIEAQCQIKYGVRCFSCYMTKTKVEISF